MSYKMNEMHPFCILMCYLALLGLLKNCWNELGRLEEVFKYSRRLERSDIICLMSTHHTHTLYLYFFPCRYWIRKDLHIFFPLIVSRDTFIKHAYCQLRMDQPYLICQFVLGYKKATMLLSLFEGGEMKRFIGIEVGKEPLYFLLLARATSD